VAESYSQQFSASGGVEPYAWRVTSGTLPPGLVLSPEGLLNGKPDGTGAFFFTVTVTDSSGKSAAGSFILLVILPPTPVVSVSGLKDTIDPAQQPSFDVLLSSSYPRDITGTVTLTFEPDAVNPSDDPSIQFSSGGRILNFTVPAGQTRAAWAAAPALQTGTVAGKIMLKLQYWADGQNLTPVFAPFRIFTVARAVPQITGVQMVKTSGGLNVLVSGYSTPRAVTEAAFEFTATETGSARTLFVTVDLDAAFTAWYTGAPSAVYGSAFQYTQPFTVQGNVSAITSVSVTLSNPIGASQAVAAAF